MAGSPNARILEALSAARLREVAEALNVQGARRSKEDLVETVDSSASFLTRFWLKPHGSIP